MTAYTAVILLFQPCFSKHLFALLNDDSVHQHVPGHGKVYGFHPFLADLDAALCDQPSGLAFRGRQSAQHQEIHDIDAALDKFFLSNLCKRHVVIIHGPGKQGNGGLLCPACLFFPVDQSSQVIGQDFLCPDLFFRGR